MLACTHSIMWVHGYDVAASSLSRKPDRSSTKVIRKSYKGFEAICVSITMLQQVLEIASEPNLLPGDIQGLTRTHDSIGYHSHSILKPGNRQIRADNSQTTRQSSPDASLSLREGLTSRHQERSVQPPDVIMYCSEAGSREHSALSSANQFNQGLEEASESSTSAYGPTPFFV